MAEESPFIEEKKVETEAKPVDVDALMKTLDQFEVDNPEQLQGKLQNANDFSNMQSERDQIANELRSINAEVASLRNQPAAQPIDDYQEGQPVDIESIVAKSVEKVWNKKEQEAQSRIQHENAIWSQIQNIKGYSLVKDEFEESLKDNANVMKFRSGQVDVKQHVNDMIFKKMYGIVNDTKSAFSQMKGSGEITPPHIEGNARVPQSNKEEVTAKEKKINEIRERAKKGVLTDLDQDDLIDTGLADFLNK